MHDTKLVGTTQLTWPTELYTLEGYHAELQSAEALVSGGFLASFYPPIPTGLVKVDGIELSGESHAPGLDGLLCIDEGSRRVEIRRFLEGDATTNIHCLQSGPLLVDRGLSLATKSNRKFESQTFYKPWRRAFVGCDSDGRCFFGIVENMEIEALASWLVGSVDDGGLGAREALSLSGADTAGIYMPITSAGLGDSDILLPMRSQSCGGELRLLESLGNRSILWMADRRMVVILCTLAAAPHLVMAGHSLRMVVTQGVEMGCRRTVAPLMRTATSHLATVVFP